MRKLFITAIILLFTISAYAQIGMPQELTCTEEAFTFSTSFGASWKLITPRMGPVETMENSPYAMVGWSLKVDNVISGTLLPFSFEKPLHTDDLNQQKFVSSACFISHTNYFNRPISLKPGFLTNPHQYTNGYGLQASRQSN